VGNMSTIRRVIVAGAGLALIGLLVMPPWVEKIDYQGVHIENRFPHSLLWSVPAGGLARRIDLTRLVPEIGIVLVACSCGWIIGRPQVKQ